MIAPPTPGRELAAADGSKVHHGAARSPAVNALRRAIVERAERPPLPQMRRLSLPCLCAVAAAALIAAAPNAACARPYGYHPAGGAWGSWGPGYRPGWGAWGGWGYRAPYYGYGYGYGVGLATGAALAWSAAGPWWPANYWGGASYAYPAAYYPYASVAVAVPAAPIEPVYVERTPEVVVTPTAPQKRPGRWYYCNAPAGYYPYVHTCSEPWIAVIPQAGATARPNGAAQGTQGE